MLPGLRILRGCSSLLLLVLVALAGWGLWQWATWPDVAALREREPETTAFIERYRERQAEDGAATKIDRRWVPYGRISDSLKQAVLVSEDIGFFDHNGFAVEEIKSAVRETVQEGKELRGASTLSQQLVKNLWLSPSRSPWRKVKEALLTLQLERELDKRRILELYLNVVEFGPGIYGAEAAARRYFGVSAAALSRRQAAELAAVLPRPRAWQPGSENPEYRRRVASIERRMQKARWILGSL